MNRTSTARRADHAFVPDPLPPDWGWPEGLWPVLLEAHKAQASLDGVAYNTAKSDVERLVKAGILREVREAKRRTFLAPEILSTTFSNEPAGPRSR